jgi:hypothetical protein
MKLGRASFLSFASFVALGIGLFALAAPEALLAGKGVAPPRDAATVWVRELGVTILALGLTLFLLRKEPLSPSLRAVLLGNAVVHLGLFPIELGAHHQGVITRLSGVVPNSILHLVFAGGFLWFATRKAPDDRSRA